MEYSWAEGKLIYEKNQKQKISCRSPFKIIIKETSVLTLNAACTVAMGRVIQFSQQGKCSFFLPGPTRPRSKELTRVSPELVQHFCLQLEFTPGQERYTSWGGGSRHPVDQTSQGKKVFSLVIDRLDQPSNEILTNLLSESLFCMPQFQNLFRHHGQFRK